MNPISTAPAAHTNRPAKPGPGMDCWPMPGGQKEIGPGQKEIGPGQKGIGGAPGQLPPGIQITIQVDSIQLGGPGGARSGLQLP